MPDLTDVIPGDYFVWIDALHLDDDSQISYYEGHLVVTDPCLYAQIYLVTGANADPGNYYHGGSAVSFRPEFYSNNTDCGVVYSCDATYSSATICDFFNTEGTPPIWQFTTVDTATYNAGTTWEIKIDASFDGSSVIFSHTFQMIILADPCASATV